MKQMMLISAICSMLTGCVAWSTELTPTNPQVPVKLRGEDCMYHFMGIGAGNISADVARKNGRAVYIPDDPGYSQAGTITSIRSILLNDFYLMGLYGERCIVVRGAP